MKKILVYTIILVSLLASCKQEPSFRIYGTLDNNLHDGAKIFLVPADGPQTSETVDSIRIKDGKFYFEGTKEQVSILRMEMKHRLNYQDLLVITEPGDIHVYYSKKGTTAGTLQNDHLQQWKDALERADSITSPLYKKWYNTKSSEDSIRYFEAMKREREILGERTKEVIVNEGQTTLGRFLYARNRSIFSNDQKQVMDSLYNR